MFPFYPFHNVLNILWKVKKVSIQVTFGPFWPGSPRMPSGPEHLHETLQHTLSATASCRERAEEKFPYLKNIKHVNQIFLSIYKQVLYEVLTSKHVINIRQSPGEGSLSLHPHSYVCVLKRSTFPPSVHSKTLNPKT